LNSTSTPGTWRSCSATLSSTRPRATCLPTRARMSDSSKASDCGTRSCRSRYRWLSARIVTVTVARSSSRAIDANPVMDLIISYFVRGAPPPRTCRGSPSSARRNDLLPWRSINRDDAALCFAPLQQLQLIERGVRAFGVREELVVPAHLHDAAALED